MMSCAGNWGHPAAGRGAGIRRRPADTQRAGRIGIATLISNLPDHQRVPFVLRYVKRLDFERVSEILGQPPEKVRLDLNRAVNALREALSESRRRRVER